MTTTSEIGARLRELAGEIDPATKKGRRRRAIIAAASERFASVGYQKTSMDDVAAAVGVAKGTLYLYFPTKVDLLIACTAVEKLTMVPQQEAILASAEPASVRLRAWIVFALVSTARSPLLCRLLDGDTEMAEVLAEVPREQTAESEHRFLELLAPLVKEVAGSGHRWSEIEVQDRCNAIRSILLLAPLLRHEWARPGMSAERFANVLADLLVDGLSATPGDAR